MLKRFAHYFKPHKKMFFLDLFCALIVAVCDLFYPMVAKDIINVYVPERNLRLLIVWSLVLLGIYLLKLGMNYIVAFFGHMVGVHIQADMRRDLFRHLEKLPFSYYDENKTGSIMSRLINDLFEVSELAHHGPEDLFLCIVMFIGSFIMLSTINIWLTLVVFAVLPFILYFAVRMRKSMSEAFRKSREQIAELNADIEASVSGMRVSRAYTAEAHEEKRFAEENVRYQAARELAYKAMGKFHSGMTFFTDFLYLVVLAAGGLFFFYGMIDTGEFAAYLLYISMFLSPIKRFVNFFEQLQEGMTGLGRFCEIMDIKPEEEAPDAKVLENPQGHIRFDNVSFSYSGEESANRMVIDNLTLDIPKGKTLALVGPSGGGKTTICNLIPRFYEISAGSITVDGYDIRSLTRHSLRKAIGIVSQDVFLFNGTVKENIAYGDFDANDDAIVEAAKKANIHDFIMTLPNGYDTNVGERGVKLSGGQKQRISIARVFLKNPPILILDEATSALDNATEMQIQSALELLSGGRTVVVVAHRLSTVQNADEIVFIDRTGIVERGSHDVLMAKDGAYRALYEASAMKPHKNSI